MCEVPCFLTFIQQHSCPRPKGQQRGVQVRKLRRLPWRLPKQNAPTENAPVERDEPVERPALTQPVAYIAGRYVYSHADERHTDGPRRGLFARHRGTRAA
jgi:hypothetical protein